MSAEPRWLTSVNNYLKDAILIHESDLWAARKIRAFEKWWFELIRNLLVVSAFNFLAQKSESTLLKILGTATYLLLFSYCISFANSYSIRFFPYIKSERLNFWLNLIVWIIIFIPIFYSVAIGFQLAFNALSKVSPR